MKPHIRYRTDWKSWVCFTSNAHGCGDTIEEAWDDWFEQSLDWDMKYEAAH